MHWQVRMVFRKSVFFKMVTSQNSPDKYGGTLHFKTENTNPLWHVADTLPIKINNTYKYKDI